MAIHHHEGDLPANVTFTGSVAIDTETMGLNPFRDALCVVQLSDGKGDAHVVRLKRPDYDCPNLKALVSNPRILKIFHFARFDLGMIAKHFGVRCAPAYCTRTASRLVRTEQTEPDACSRATAQAIFCIARCTRHCRRSPSSRITTPVGFPVGRTPAWRLPTVT